MVEEGGRARASSSRASCILRDVTGVRGGRRQCRLPAASAPACVLNMSSTHASCSLVGGRRGAAHSCRPPRSLLLFSGTSFFIFLLGLRRTMGRVVLWDVYADIPERQRRAVPSLAGHASGRARQCRGRELSNFGSCRTSLREWYSQAASPLALPCLCLPCLGGYGK